MEHMTDCCECQGKQCPKCNECLCIECFALAKTKKGTLTRYSYCKGCSAKRREEWIRNNPEKAKQSRQRWAENNPDYHKKRSKENPDLVARKNKEWKERNPGKLKENVARYNRSESAKQAQSRYKEKHPNRQYIYNEKAKERAKKRTNEWNRQHPESVKAYNSRYKARKRNAPGHYTSQEWIELIIKYNFTCLCCGKREPEIKLTADHIVPLSKGGTNFIDNIQPLCFVCNTKKRAKTQDFRPTNS